MENYSRVPRPFPPKICTSVVVRKEHRQSAVGIERLVGTQRGHAKPAPVGAGQYDVIFNSEEVEIVTAVPDVWIKVYH